MTNPMSIWIDRLKNWMTPKKLLAIVGVVLIVVFTTRGCDGVDLSRDEAMAIATAAFEADEDHFEPEITESKVLRQGIPSRAMWIVVFAVPDPDGKRSEFLKHAKVRIDAGTGDLVDLVIHQSDDG